MVLVSGLILFDCTASKFEEACIELSVTTEVIGYRSLDNFLEYNIYEVRS